MNTARSHTVTERKPLTIRAIADNRAARFEYAIDDEIEAGIELVGSEVKSLRRGGVQLAGSFARFHNGELWLENAHISVMKEANINNHDPLRTRKLLLHKSELNKLSRRVQTKGVTIVPTKIYFKGNRVKILLGVAVGKKQHDKRESIKERDRKRESQREND